MQWLLPGLIALMIMAAHFGYNEVRVQSLQDQLTEVRLDFRTSLTTGTDRDSDISERLVRVETKIDLLLQGNGLRLNK